MNDYEYTPVTESWSAGYDVVHNANVRTYDKEEAIMDGDMFGALARRFPSPIVGFLEGIHYQFKPVDWIPAGSLAVPEDNHTDEPVFLIQK